LSIVLRFKYINKTKETAMAQSSQQGQSMNTFGMVLAAAAAGAITALLLAPKKGSELREDIRGRAMDMQTKAQKKAEIARNKMNRSVDTAKNKAQDAADNVKATVNDAADKAKESADEAADNAKEANNKTAGRTGTGRTSTRS
jgi:gas vesicle protein